MSTRLSVPLVTIALCASVLRLEAQETPDARIADLVRAGRLRVALYLPQYTPDSITGKVGRIGAVGAVLVELANRLGTRIGVDVIVDGYPTPPSVVTCLKERTCDVAMMGPDESRDADIDLSHPVIESDYTYLVPPGSMIQRGVPMTTTERQLSNERTSATVRQRCGLRSRALCFRPGDIATKSCSPS